MGLSRKAIARCTGISVRTLSRWCNQSPERNSWSGPEPRGERIRANSLPAILGSADLGAYAYLLGLYLGDGHIAEHHRGVYQLRISMDSRYPGIIEETVSAMQAVLPRNRANVRNDPGTRSYRSSAGPKRCPPCFLSMARAENIAGGLS